MPHQLDRNLHEQLVAATPHSPNSFAGSDPLRFRLFNLCVRKRMRKVPAMEHI